MSVLDEIVSELNDSEVYCKLRNTYVQIRTCIRCVETNCEGFKEKEGIFRRFHVTEEQLLESIKK